MIFDHFVNTRFALVAGVFVLILGMAAAADCIIDLSSHSVGRNQSSSGQSTPTNHNDPEEGQPDDPSGKRRGMGIIQTARSIILGPAAAAFIGLLVAGILWKNDLGERISPATRKWIDWAIITLATVEVGAVVALCVLRIITPAAWDFPFFYVPAKAAVEGQAFYDPSVLTAVFDQVTLETPVPSDWLQEVSYAYLPPSMLLLAPLGLMSYRWALSIHYLIHGLLLIGSIVLAHRLAPVREGWMGRVETAVLFLSFAPVLKVFNGAQITFGALFFLILALLEFHLRPFRAGISLGLGFLFKHQLLIVAAFSIFIKRLRSLVGFTLTALATVALSVIVFGLNTCMGFIAFGASSRISLIGFDRVNHSLHATLIRLLSRGEPLESFGDLVLYPPYVMVAGALTVITISICARGGWTRTELLLKSSLFIALMMIAYPLTLYGTLPLVLPVFLVLYFARTLLPAPSWLVPLFIGSQYALVLIRPFAFWLLLLTWLATCAATLWAQRPNSEPGIDRFSESI